MNTLLIERRPKFRALLASIAGFTSSIQMPYHIFCSFILLHPSVGVSGICHPRAMTRKTRRAPSNPIHLLLGQLLCSKKSLGFLMGYVLFQFQRIIRERPAIIQAPALVHIPNILPGKGDRITVYGAFVFLPFLFGRISIWTFIP